MAMNDIEATLSQLTLAEKVSLLAGGGACSTLPLPRLNIPTLQVRLSLEIVVTLLSSNVLPRLPTALMVCVAVEAASLTLYGSL